jgi:radical SAM protein with 4Fe4S-binding SPASM domain
MVQRAKDLWQLRSVQITLDGTEQTYNRVKAYVHQGVNAFERVLQNIGMLTAAGIDVRIRLNVDKHNIGEMADLVELLHQRFGTNEHLSIYSIDLYGERSPENNAELFEQKRQLDQQIAAYACGRNQQRLQKDIVPYFCSVDDDGKVVIAPDGHLSGCQHFIGSKVFGHIDRKERNEAILRKFKERFDDSEDCATCFYYPRCNRLVVCKDCNVCTPEKRQERLYEMKEAMKNEYEIYLDNANHHSGKTTD